MTEPSSIESTNSQIIIGKEIYDLKSQISYKENNFYTTYKVDTDKYIKLNGHNSKQKIYAANAKHTIVTVFRKLDFNEENSSDSYLSCKWFTQIYTVWHIRSQPLHTFHVAPSVSSTSLVTV